MAVASFEELHRHERVKEITGAAGMETEALAQRLASRGRLQAR
jgi:hypothetical protein